MMFKINYSSRSKFGILVFLMFACSSINAQVGGESKLPQYLFPGFTESVLKMKDGKSRSLDINYNFVSGKMVYKIDEEFYNLLNSETVDTIYLNNSRFVPYENFFIEVLVTGNISLYLQHTGQLTEVGKDAGYGTTSQTSSITNISGMYSSHQYMNFKLPDNIRVDEDVIYWLRKDGNMITFRNKKQFLEIFPDLEDILSEFIKSDKIKFNSREDLIKLLEYTNKSLSGR